MGEIVILEEMSQGGDTYTVSNIMGGGVYNTYPIRDLIFDIGTSHAAHFLPGKKIFKIGWTFKTAKKILLHLQCIKQNRIRLGMHHRAKFIKKISKNCINDLISITITI